MGAYGQIKEGMVKVFDPACAETNNIDIGAAVVSAQDMGTEATLEPRFWRTAWKTAEYNQSIAAIRGLKSSLLGIESRASEAARLGSQKTKAFTTFLSLVS